MNTVCRFWVDLNNKQDRNGLFCTNQVLTQPQKQNAVVVREKSKDSWELVLTTLQGQKNWATASQGREIFRTFVRLAFEIPEIKRLVINYTNFSYELVRGADSQQILAKVKAALAATFRLCGMNCVEVENFKAVCTDEDADRLDC